MSQATEINGLFHLPKCDLWCGTHLAPRWVWCVHKTCSNLTFHWTQAGALTNLEKGVMHRLHFSIERERCP